MRLLIFILLLSVSASAQVDTSAQLDTSKIYGGYFSGRDVIIVGGWVPNTPIRSRVISTYDTTILNKGKDSCTHVFVSEKPTFSNIGCAVYHGDTGCPDNWLNLKSICEHCLRHIHV